MTARGEFAYAQARLQARHGAMADPSVWQALAASRTAAHFLALARSGPLARWVDGIDERADAHRIERQLRAAWRRLVDDVARWPPLRWRAAVRWFETLPELPLLAEFRRGTPAADWWQADPRLVAWFGADVTMRAPAAGRADLGELASPAETDDLAARWLTAWHQRLPRDGRDMAQLARPFEWLLPPLRDGGAARGADTAATRHALVRLFRRHAATAVALFAHLALMALELERLRGGLMVRVAFETGREPPAA